MTFRQLEISLRQPFTRARVFRMNIYIYTYVWAHVYVQRGDICGKKENVVAEWDMRNRFGRIYFFFFFLTTDLTELI